MNIGQRNSVMRIMTKQPLYINVDDTLHHACKIMRENCIRHLPVIDNGQLAGILSNTDLERVKVPGAKGQEVSFYQGFTIGTVMTKNVHTIQVEDSIKDAAELLSFCNYHAIPVMAGEDLVGIVTSTDVINYLLENSDK